MTNHQAIQKFKVLTGIQPKIDVVLSITSKKPIIDIMDLDAKFMSQYIEYTDDLSLQEFLTQKLPDVLPLVKIMCDIK